MTAREVISLVVKTSGRGTPGAIKRAWPEVRRQEKQGEKKEVGGYGERQRP